MKLVLILVLLLTSSVWSDTDDVVTLYSPQTMKVQEGADVKLHCGSMGNNNIEIVWIKDDRYIIPSDKISFNENEINSMSFKTSVLHITGAKVGDQGKYKCVSRNVRAKDVTYGESEYATVLVNTKARPSREAKLFYGLNMLLKTKKAKHVVALVTIILGVVILTTCFISFAVMVCKYKCKRKQYRNDLESGTRKASTTASKSATSKWCWFNTMSVQSSSTDKTGKVMSEMDVYLTGLFYQPDLLNDNAENN